MPKLPQRLLGLRMVARRLMPVVSLLLGVAGAVMMDRRDERVGRLVAVMTLGWLLGLAAVLATTVEQHRQEEPPELRKRTGIMARWRRNTLYSFAERTAVQICLSQALFFPLPHYLRSFAGTPAQMVFMGLLAVACTVLLVDALYDRVYARPVAFTVLMAFSVACALQLALPILLDLPLRMTLFVSVAAAGVLGGLPVLVKEQLWGFRLGQTVVGWLLCLWALETAVFLGWMGRAVPMVPLVLEAAAAGDPGVDVLQPVEHLQRDARRPAPLSCAAALRGPANFKDDLVVVWTLEDQEMGRQLVPLALGVNTLKVENTLKKLGPHPWGAWKCTFHSTAGQVLGGVEFDLQEATALPPMKKKRNTKKTVRSARPAAAVDVGWTAVNAPIPMAALLPPEEPPAPAEPDNAPVPP